MAVGARPSQRIYRFDPFELDVWSGELRKYGTKLKVQEQPLRVLGMLLARPGELVTREQLQEGLWPKNTFVDFDRGLNTAVNRLRVALNDSAESPRFIETVGSRGYRFVGSVALNHSEKTETLVKNWRHGGTVYPSPAEDQENSPGARPHDTSLVPSDARASGNWKLVAAILAGLVVAVVSTGYAAYWWRSQVSKPNLEQFDMTKLTNSGKADDVAISPDGRYVAYIFRDRQESSVRLRQVRAAGEVQVLVHEPLLAPGLAFSPDGNHLYFLRSSPTDTLYKDLYEIPALGGPERKVRSHVDSPISFSPNGQQFAYQVGLRKTDTVEIRIADTTGGEDHLLAAIQNAGAFFMPGAAWSPDGSTIAISLWMLNQQPANVIDVISTQSGSVRQLYASDQAIGRPRWLPDGKMLVVPMNVPHDRRTQLWTVSYPGGEVRRLTNDLADYDSGLDTTSDGKMLATIQWSRVANLWVSPAADVSDGNQITFGEQRVYSIIPLRGDQIAFTNRVDNGLYVMNADGTHQRLIASVPDTNWFNTCGRYILFESSRASTWDLMRMDVDGGALKRLSTGGIWGAVCSADGQLIYFAETMQSRVNIRRMSIEGGPSVDVAENPGDSVPGNVALSPDGQMLAFPYDIAEPRPALKIALLAARGGPIVREFDVAGDKDGYIHGPRWSPDGKGLQYLLYKDGVTNLWEQSITGGAAHSLTNFTAGRIFDFNWTLDGKHLLLSRGDTTSDVVLLTKTR